MKIDWNAAQKRAIIALLALLVCITLWRIGNPAPVSEATQSSVFNPESDSLPMADLNAADSVELDALPGIGPTFARRIVRYRELIGGFEDKEQLLEIYGITPQAFIRIEPHVYVDTSLASYRNCKAKRPHPKFAQQKSYAQKESFGSGKGVHNKAHSPSGTDFQPAQHNPQPSGQTTVNRNRDVKPLALVNVNTADSAMLEKVPGIGPGTASRIVKYRNRLAFFRSLDQLKEVWGIRPENLEKMTAHLKVGNLDAFPRVDINGWDVEHLGRHPYIGFKNARILVAYREEHGPFTRSEDLRWVGGIDPALPGRLEGYLQF